MRIQEGKLEIACFMVVELHHLHPSQDCSAPSDCLVALLLKKLSNHFQNTNNNNNVYRRVMHDILSGPNLLNYLSSKRIGSDKFIFMILLMTAPNQDLVSEIW